MSVRQLTRLSTLNACVSLFLSSLCLLSSTAASAQEPWIPQRSSTSLPGLNRVHLPYPSRAPLAFALSGGYGYFENFSPRSAPTHRSQGSLALSISTTDSLDIFAQFSGWADRTQSTEQSSGRPIVGIPQIGARYSFLLRPHWRLAAQFGLELPGRAAPSLSLSAASPNLILLTAMQVGSSVFAAQVGARLDRSNRTIANNESILPGDKISAGISDFNAALLGLGWTLRNNTIEPFAELTSDLFLDQNALAKSPVRFSTGARMPIGKGFALGLIGELLLSARPNDQRFYRHDPRFSSLLTLSWQVETKPPIPQAPIPQVAPTPKPIPTALAQRFTIKGEVVAENGKAIAAADVRITGEGFQQNVATDQQGRFSFENLPSPSANLEVHADSFDNYSGTINSESSEQISLQPAVPLGEFRGTVMTYTGKPLQATIRIEGSSRTTQSNNSGQFSLEAEPGQYVVIVEADGHAPQKRRLSIENKGVTVFNVHLVPKK